MTSAEDAQNVAPGETRSELLRILASPDFAASRQLTNFLQYIVSESLAGRSENLKERTVARGALGRGTDFDPRLDCVVRVMAGKLRRSLDHYYALQGASDSICIEMPKGRYCPVFRSRRQAPRAGNDAKLMPIENATAQPVAAHPKVVVVPLKSFTGGDKERFFADLLIDDVAVRLGRMSGLEVIDCTAMRSSSNRARDLCQLALRLHANFVFGGTVSRVGHRIRESVRLIDGDSGVLAWGDQYDLHIDNEPLEQQDYIADCIATGIGRHFCFA